jgi:uncharacterized protein (TIGR02246 family)
MLADAQPMEPIMKPLARFAIVAALFAGATLAWAEETSPSPADRQSILEIVKQHDAALNRKDAAAAAALFTDDALIVPPGPPFAGRDAIRKDMEKNIGNGFADHASTVDQIHVSGDLAWTTGEWSMTIPGPDNARRPLHGNYSTVEQRDGGGWKVRMLTYNLVMPPASTTAANR